MAQAGLPTGALVGGVAARSVILQDYVFQAGIHEPEISNILSYKYPQYYMTALLDRIGASSTISSDTHSWFTLDRTRQSATVKATTGLVSGGTTSDTTAVLILDGITYDSDALGYFVLKDVVRFDSGDLGRVTATQATSGEQQISVTKIGTGNWSVLMVAGTTTLGHMFSAFEEGSSAPDGRSYLPTEDYNHTTIVSRSFAVSGSEFTNKSRIGDGKAWYFTVEGIEMNELARDKEAAVMFGELSSSGTLKTNRGIWSWVAAEGQSGQFAAATGVVETDLQDVLKDLLIEGSSDKILCLAGGQFLMDANRALKDYHVGGAINYGGFGGNEVGLDVQSYRFLGKTIDFVHYALFNDTEMLPYAGTASSTKIDFDNVGLFLDMGNDSTGNKLISLKYKELNGQSRKFIHAYETGIMSPEGASGGHVSNLDDKFKGRILSELTVEFRLPNRSAILRSTS